MLLICEVIEVRHVKGFVVKKQKPLVLPSVIILLVLYTITSINGELQSEKKCQKEMSTKLFESQCGCLDQKGVED